MSYAAFVASRFKAFPDNPALTLHHATTGMVGEWIELLDADSEANVREELGDFEFYLEALIQTMGWRIPFPLPLSGPFPEPSRRILILAGELLDKTKKYWVYEKPVAAQEDLVPLVTDLYNALAVFYHICHLDRDAILAENVAKLEKRYPSGYSNAAAIARADKGDEHATPQTN